MRILIQSRLLYNNMVVACYRAFRLKHFVPVTTISGQTDKCQIGQMPDRTIDRPDNCQSDNCQSEKCELDIFQSVRLTVIEEFYLNFLGFFWNFLEIFLKTLIFHRKTFFGRDCKGLEGGWGVELGWVGLGWVGLGWVGLGWGWG